MSPQIAPRWRVKDETKFRRYAVREMLGQGYNQAEIARRLGKSMGTIPSDVVYLREQDVQDYQRHKTEWYKNTYISGFGGIKFLHLKGFDYWSFKDYLIQEIVFVYDLGESLRGFDFCMRRR
jgi:hypothetical protein